MAKNRPMPPGAINPEIPLVDPQMLEHQTEEDNFQDMAEDSLAATLGQDDNGGYYRTPAPGDKGKIIQYINTIEVEKEKIIADDKGQIVSHTKTGDVDYPMYKNLSGWLAHNASMSNYDKTKIQKEEISLDRIKLLIRMATPREEYTPEFALRMHNALHLAMTKLYQNLDGDERYYCAVDLLDERRRLSFDKGQGAPEGLLARIKKAAQGGGNL